MLLDHHITLSRRLKTVDKDVLFILPNGMKKLGILVFILTVLIRLVAFVKLTQLNHYLSKRSNQINEQKIWQITDPRQAIDSEEMKIVV